MSDRQHQRSGGTDRRHRSSNERNDHDFDLGYSRGHERATIREFRRGRAEGYAAGIYHGRQEGYEYGRREGYGYGHDDGKYLRRKEGYTEGQRAGYTEGNNDGHGRGYDKCLQDRGHFSHNASSRKRRNDDSIHHQQTQEKRHRSQPNDREKLILTSSTSHKGDVATEIVFDIVDWLIVTSENQDLVRRIIDESIRKNGKTGDSFSNLLSGCKAFLSLQKNEALAIENFINGDMESEPNILIWKRFYDRYSQKYSAPLDMHDFLFQLSEKFANHLSFLNVVSRGSRKRAFYVQGGTHVALFRHKGSNEKQSRPSEVFLRRIPPENKVWSYFSASGTGKTIDLASSAYIFGQHLTVYLKPGREIAKGNLPENSDQDYYASRHNAAKILMKECLNEVLLGKDELWEALSSRTYQHQNLRIAVAIDEASCCPLFIRDVISCRDNFVNIVQTALRGVGITASDDVVFCVAGTGSSSGSIGSEPSKWSQSLTSATSNPVSMFDALAGGDLATEYHRDIDAPVSKTGSQTTQITLKTLQENSPMLYTLATYNARMASIVVDELIAVIKSYLDNFESFDVFALSKMEPYIAMRTIRRFINSNGLQPLLNDAPLACQVGAQVLATRLFECQMADNQRNMPVQPDADFNYGIAESFEDNSVAMKDLVATYGMITPVDYTQGGVEPFTVDESMQLVALYLLQLPPSQALFTNDFAGFELITAQIIKAALAASSVIRFKIRPSVYDTLVKIGFEYCKPLEGEKIQDFTDHSLMQRFKKIRVVRHTAEKDLAKNDIVATKVTFNDYRTTYFQKHPMSLRVKKAKEIKDVKFLDKNGEIDETRVHKLSEGDEVLTIESHLKSTIGTLKSLNQSQVQKDSLFPFASISYGNSSLFDSIIVFYGIEFDEPNETDYYDYSQSNLFAIMNQSKDYGPDTSLEVEKISDNVTRCRSKQLDFIFGTNRLMCVSSRGRQLVSQPIKYKRDFMAYCVDKQGVPLHSLQEQLYALRHKSQLEEDKVEICRYFEQS